MAGNSLNENEHLSPEDIKVFEAENEQLYNELNTLSEEVEQIESKVVEIAQLQEIFTEKVQDQDRNLERIFTQVNGQQKMLMKLMNRYEELFKKMQIVHANVYVTLVKPSLHRVAVRQIAKCKLDFMVIQLKRIGSLVNIP